MRVVNFKHEKARTFIGTVLTIAHLIKLDINEENFYQFVARVEGKLNTSMSPWMLGHQPEKTREQNKKPKVKGHYHASEVYKIGRLVREKTGHKAQVNWIY